MTDEWNKARLQKYIDDEIEESLTLEYKAAGSLGKTDGKKREICKDVSAMANSAGGTLIYGIAECQDRPHKHKPEKFDPVDGSDLSKEWLEQIINNIRPKIDALIIHPVRLSSNPNHVIYVVEIPQSNTAHQATDYRYYKRHNFESVPMEDYEIRDVMGRGQFPHIELSFEIIKIIHDTPSPPTSSDTSSPWDRAIDIAITAYSQPKRGTDYSLEITATNTGTVYAQYINIFAQIPYKLTDLSFSGSELLDQTFDEDGTRYYEYRDDNLIGTTSSTRLYDPLLPGLARSWNFNLTDEFEQISLDNLTIKWDVYADNAPPSTGQILVKEIPITERRF